MISAKELDLFIKVVYSEFGYDFSQYEQQILQHRLAYLQEKLQFKSPNEIISYLLLDRTLFPEILSHLTITATEMFRDPQVFKYIREHILPILATYSRIKIWHAGCATGEEAFAFTILLHEENLLDRAIIYATDINDQALRRAKAGILPLSSLSLCEQNYFKAGGKQNFFEYLTIDGGNGVFKDFIRNKIVFSDHNLVSDHSFSEVEIIFCRNVLIYFQKDLRNKVLTLFTHSLSHKGYLCLGHTETLRFTAFEHEYELISRPYKIHRLR